MAYSVPLDMRDINVVPFFKIVNVEDIPASERAGHLVMKSIEVVEVRFAGSNLYSPVFPAHAVFERQGNRAITYAERWAEQYRAFIDGSEQMAQGTPLEMLKSYGISEAQLSLCRVWKIYSIEALHALEGPNLKNLNMYANDLKRMAAAFMAERAKGGETLGELEKLRAELAAMKASMVIPEKEPTADDRVGALLGLQAAPDAFEAMNDDQLRAWITERAKTPPKGKLEHDALVAMARELQAA